MRTSGSHWWPSPPVTIPLLSMVALVFGRSLWGIYAFSLGFVLGTLLQLFVLGWGLKRLGYLLFPLWYGTTPALWQVLAQYLPDDQRAACSDHEHVPPWWTNRWLLRLVRGACRSSITGNKVVSLILGVTSTAIGTAVLPFFSKNRCLRRLDQAGAYPEATDRLDRRNDSPLDDRHCRVFRADRPTARFSGVRSRVRIPLAVGGVQAMYALQIPVYHAGYCVREADFRLGVEQSPHVRNDDQFYAEYHVRCNVDGHMGIKGIASHVICLPGVIRLSLLLLGHCRSEEGWSMRVTMLIYDLDCGGAERVQSTMANFWAAKGWSVTLMTVTGSTSPASTSFTLRSAAGRWGSPAIRIPQSRPCSRTPLGFACFDERSGTAHRMP